VPAGLTAENCKAKSGSVGVPLYNVRLKVILHITTATAAAAAAAANNNNNNMGEDFND